MYFDEWPVRQPSLFFAGLAYQEPAYLDLWASLDGSPTAEEVDSEPAGRPPDAVAGTGPAALAAVTAQQRDPISSRSGSLSEPKVPARFLLMSIEIAVVPVAGLGTRLLPATKSQPKEMLPVGRKPVVQYVVEELRRVGMSRVLFITGPGKASIENHFDLNGELIQILRETGKEDLLGELEFERAAIQYFYTRQRQTLGLGHAVLCARSFVGHEPFVVALGDSIIGLHAQSDVVRRMTACYEERRADAVIAFEEVPRAEVRRYGIAKPRIPATSSRSRT